MFRRGYEAADADALADLVNTIEVYGGGHAGATGDELQAAIDNMIRDSARDTMMVFAPDGTLVAAALTATPPAGGFRVDLWGGVHPQWRGRGFGRELLGGQLARAAEIHRDEAAGAAWEVHTGTALGDESAVRLYERFGLTPARYWFEMVAPTADVPAVPLPDGQAVATYAPEHEKDLYEAHMEAFSDHWGFQWRDLEVWANLTVRSSGFLPELSLVAFDGGELTGYVLSYEDADATRLYIGQVGVRRAWRRRGLAAAMMSEVLSMAGAQGMTAVGLGVDADSPTGAVGVYERVGFAVESRAVTYSAPLGG